MAKAPGPNLQALDPEGDFEPRADNVDEKVLLEGTVSGDLFSEVHKALKNRRMRLVEGPRGCGKTHMMRYAYLECAGDPGLPFAVYVSFSRYLRLEPFLRTRVEAVSYFQAWTLCRIVLAAYEACERATGFKAGVDAAASLEGIVGVTRRQAAKLVGRLERAAAPKADELEAIENLTVEVVAAGLDRLCALAGRSRTVVLLDDAALTLTPEYLFEFFEVVRTLNTQTTAPKCSVYPGTTEYGPRFHARQQATTVKAWLEVDHDGYLDIMLAIGDRRFGDEAASVPVPVKRYLAYTAFGMPRAYLTLLNDFMRANGGSRQQILNKLVADHRAGVVAEYRTLKLKMPKFASIVDAGSRLFDKCVVDVSAANQELKERRQLEIGFEKEDRSHLMQRMCALLTEVGLLHRLPDVKHGGERVYVRFMPHVGALMAARAFSESSRGQDVEKIVAFLQRKRVEHPVRRTMSKMIEEAMPLRVNLPPCEHCGVARVTDDQKFCHNCGKMLTDASNFTRLMTTPAGEIPTMSDFQRQVLEDLGIATIQDFFSLEDPGGTLRLSRGVGPRYSKRIIEKIQVFVDEFLT